MSGMDWELLDRYLARECTADERERVERWMDAAPLNRRRVELLVEAISATPATPRVEVRESIERQLDAPRKGFSLGARPAQSAFTKVAVVLLVVGGGALAGRALLSPEPDTPRPAPAMRVVTTPPGQRASFRLPDGTSVMLGVASTLRHAVGFGTGARDVELEGEAYFEVAHDESSPFVVRSGDLIATDLGTAFLVQSFPEDGGSRVVVREGAVGVRSKLAADHSAERVVAPGELGRLGVDGVPLVEPADTASYFAWTEGRLVFRRTPLRTALPRLGRWYDVEFRLADSSLADIEISGVFKDQLTDDALGLLDLSLGLQHERQGRVIVLSWADSTP